MKYGLGATKIIHWDQEGMYKVDLNKNPKIQSIIGVEIYKVNKGRLPIIIEGQFKIIQDSIQIFSCICNTKTILSFDFGEKPMNDIIFVLNKANEQDVEQWNNGIKGTPLDGLYLKGDNINPEVKFNKAYQIMEVARRHRLLK
jgi:hypothetical protein